jgi:hypothetical protein
VRQDEILLDIHCTDSCLFLAVVLLRSRSILASP